MASAKSLDRLIRWLGRDEWQGPFNRLMDLHLTAPCARADVPMEKLPGLLRDGDDGALWGCVFEDFVSRDLDDGRNIVDDYLKRRGWNESASAKAYMTALRSSVMSLYEVSDIVPDQSFLARDLVRGGDPVRVSERLATRSLKPWDRIAARIVRLGSRVEMTGGILPFDHETSDAVLNRLQQASENTVTQATEFARAPDLETNRAATAGAVSSTEMLRASAFLFTNTWLDALLKQTLNPTLPRMCNTDGDELMFTTVSYRLKGKADSIGRALDMPSLRQETGTFWNWIARAEPKGDKPKDRDQIIITTLNDGSIVLGTIELKRGRLVLETNSEQRAERGRAMIEPILAGLIGEPAIERRTVEEMKIGPRRKSKPRPSGLLPDEERAMVHATMDEYYANLLDQPVPLLDNMTPRQAASSAGDRRRLVTWLKLLENTTARNSSGSPMAGYDATWIWEELGIADLRR